MIIIAGGGSTHRNNVVEGYPVAEYFNQQGYNAFVLQRRVNPYAAVDQQLDLARAIRFLRANASTKNIGKTDIVMAVASRPAHEHHAGHRQPIRQPDHPG